jgi:hypothetical protein
LPQVSVLPFCWRSSLTRSNRQNPLNPGIERAACRFSTSVKRRYEIRRARGSRR